jgi:hypothetical protein
MTRERILLADPPTVRINNKKFWDELIIQDELTDGKPPVVKQL